MKKLIATLDKKSSDATRKRYIFPKVSKPDKPGKPYERANSPITGVIWIAKGEEVPDEITIEIEA